MDKCISLHAVDVTGCLKRIMWLSERWRIFVYFAKSE